MFGNIGVVERSDQVGFDQLPEHIDCREEDVEIGISPVWSFANASVMVLKVVILTLQLYFFAKSSTTCWLM